MDIEMAAGVCPTASPPASVDPPNWLALRPVPSTLKTMPPPPPADQSSRPGHMAVPLDHFPSLAQCPATRHLSPSRRPGTETTMAKRCRRSIPSGNAMEARLFSFFDFPAEIRNMIYHISLQRPGCADLYRSYYRRGQARNSKGQRWARVHLKTPTILLLCRRITDESMPVLRARWFIIDRLPPCISPLPGGRGGFLRLSNFISRETVQRLEYLDLRIGLGEGALGSGWIWNRVFDELILILSEKNSLVQFRLLIRRCNDSSNRSVWTTEATEEGSIRRKIKLFQMSNPNVFRPCTITVETWRIDGQQAIFVAGLDSWQLDKDHLPRCRSYPDPELFPGSIMQFVDALPEGEWSDEDD